MKNIKNKIFISFLAVFLSINLYGCSPSGQNSEINQIKSNFFITEKQNDAPQEIFLDAWDILHDQFLDKSYNHQDWSKWKARYLNKIKTNEDAYMAVETMVESLSDPYTRLLLPSDFKEQNMNIDSKLYGIGVHIVESKKGVMIVDVIEDTPAKKASLKAGDLILKVNNKSTKGLDVRKVADMVRGQAGSHVIIDILRDNKQITKNILREEINIKSVSYKLLNKDIAYIRLTSFISKEASQEMVEALDKTKKTKAIILDLRGNNGGLLPNAIFISNMFINKGRIVSIVDRNGEQQNINAEPLNLNIKKPLVVLINQGSASASEILSGALKDHHRATLVGDRTFGKGCVQRIVELPGGGGINITIAKYLTPNGSDINKIGVKPDYFVKFSEKDFISHKDPQLEKAKAVVNSQLRINQVASR